MTANSFVEDYSDDGIGLVFVIQEMNWGNNPPPSEADCQAMQAMLTATVYYTTDKAVTNELGIPIKMGAALLDDTGTWLTSPTSESSFGDAIGKVISISFGGGFGR
jgi:hypothetical protein